MKTIAYFTLITMLFISCSKNNAQSSDPVSAGGAIQYKVNDQLVVIDNANSIAGDLVDFVKQLKQPFISSTRYLMNAQKITTNNFSFVIISDSLKVNSYHYDSAIVAADYSLYTFSINFNGQTGALISSGDVMDITVTSYGKGRLSGTFTGKFTPVNNGIAGARGTMVITEGKLNNVPVIY